MSERICVAQIGAAHGTRGEVRLRSFTADPMALMDYGALETEDATATFEIESLRPAKAYWVAQLRGVRDRNAAERLANKKLFVPRDRLPAAETDEFYHADLTGLAAFATDGRVLRTVGAVPDFGAGDILQLRPEGEPHTGMLPFSSATAPLGD